MTEPATLPALLASLKTSLTSALDSLPATTTLASPPEGLSLLDTKNELLLSYLQNLVFLIILKLRKANSFSSSSPSSTPPTNKVLKTTSSSDVDNNDDDDDTKAVMAETVQNLIALRIYMEKGVRPMEARLKYQIDKLLLIAAEQQSSLLSTSSSHAPTSTSLQKSSPASNASDTPLLLNSIPALAHRPNPAALSSAPQRSSSTSKLYRAPHIAPTAPPAKQSRRRPHPKSLQTFLAEEIGDAPLAEPSIGTGNGLTGRAAEREKERRSYEEGRLVRLPGGEKRRKRRVEEFEGLEGAGWDGFGKGMGKRRK